MKIPNIILIMTDEQRYDSLSLFRKIPATPNIDSIAKDGIVFDNSFCASPLCVPARVSLFTGQYTHRNFSISNWTALRIVHSKYRLPIDTKMLI